MSHVRRILRRPDLAVNLCMVFLADMGIGIYRATFSLFADSLGSKG